MTKGKTRYGKAAEFEALRNEGLTYAKIAAQYGCSHQHVRQTLANYDMRRFRGVTKKQCVYDGLRKWLNENSCGFAELTRRIYGYNVGGYSALAWRKKLRGEAQLKMCDIEDLMTVTGLTYEQMFRKEEG